MRMRPPGRMADKRAREGDVIDLTGDDDIETKPPAARARCFRLDEVRGDLFSVADDVSLGHCVAEDLRLGRGIAVAFKERFGGVDDMRSQNVGIGGVAALRRGRRFVYALVTKPRSSGTYPTMAAMRACLQALKTRMARDGVTRLAVPRLGCGLDKLDWPAVSALLREVFADTDASITVYSL